MEWAETGDGLVAVALETVDGDGIVSIAGATPETAGVAEEGTYPP